MPAGKRQQSSAMLYSLVIFVGLFIVATVLAVIFYVKFEDEQKKAQQAERNLAEVATNRDLQDKGRIVGTIRPGETYLGKMVDYLDKTVSIILGPLGSLGDSSAEVKVDKVNKDVNDVLKLAQERFEQTIDPNVTGLVTIVQNLKGNLDRTINEKNSLAVNLTKLQQSYDDAITATQDKEKRLEEEKEGYHQQVVDITQKYDELKQLMEKTSDERAKTLYAQLEESENNLKRTNDELLRKQAELNMTRDRMERALDELRQIKPSADTEVAAYKPDGKVILVDEQAGTVYLNIGTDNNVYPGLTFSVYDRKAPIPKSGIGKAELEVFSVDKNVSAARILPRINYDRASAELHFEFADAKEISKIMLSLDKPFDERNRDFEDIAKGSVNRMRILNNLAVAHEQRRNRSPIAINDVAANLVWDSDKTNIFVVSGEFDLNSDGAIDRNSADKVKALIEKWGGRLADIVTFDTDFLVLGYPPQVPPKPTSEDLDADPMANERYDAAMRRFNLYKEAENMARGLWVPVFTYERFLYFIGYKEQATKAGAF